MIASTRQLKNFKAGEVLVAESTAPDWEPVMKIAAAIVTERGGRTCHAAIVARELGIPAVVGATGVETGLKQARWLRFPARREKQVASMRALCR